MNVPSIAAHPQDCSVCPIRHRAICARCDDSELAELDAFKYYRSYSAGQTIAWTNDKMEFVASVVDGVASLTHTMEDGRRQMVGLLLPSDFLGHPNRETINFDVTAATDLTLCCFRRKPFHEMAMRAPHICQRLLEMTLNELDAAREWMLLLGRKTAREKIASFLVILARRGSTSDAISRMSEVTFDLPLTREAMADYLGLTLETVSRQMSALKRAGVIVLQGKRHILVPDFNLLLEETGDDSDGGLPA